MPVEFLTDDEVAAYGRFTDAPSRADLERVFLLDDEDRALVGVRRGEQSQLGFALQLVTVRWLGTFLEDPVDMPVAVVDFVAEQLGVDDASRVREYTSRRTTLFEHQLLIRREYGWVDFTVMEADFVRWVSARAWTSGDGPKAIFADALGWLRRRKVLLPGVTTLARLIAGSARRPPNGYGASWRRWSPAASGMSWSSCWRSRRGRGSRISSGGAKV